MGVVNIGVGVPRIKYKRTNETLYKDFGVTTGGIKIIEIHKRGKDPVFEMVFDALVHPEIEMKRAYDFKLIHSMDAHGVQKVEHLFWAMCDEITTTMAKNHATITHFLFRSYAKVQGQSIVPTPEELKVLNKLSNTTINPDNAASYNV